MRYGAKGRGCYCNESRHRYLFVGDPDVDSNRGVFLFDVYSDSSMGCQYIWIKCQRLFINILI